VLLGRLPEFKFIKIYKMLKGVTPVDEGIHDSFIVNLECFSYNHDQFLKDSPDAVCYRELYNSIGGFMEKSSNCFIRI
jgi:dihydroneopterin aldolase